jgi:hypothetical protein
MNTYCIFKVNQWCLLLVFLLCLLYYGENCFKNICGITNAPYHRYVVTELVFLPRLPKIIWFGNKYSGSRCKTHFELKCIKFLHKCH